MQGLTQMFRIFFIHKIFEVCINLFFEQFSKNFKNRAQNLIKVGNIYRIIGTRGYTDVNNGKRILPNIYENCRITEVKTRLLMGEYVPCVEFDVNNEYDILLTIDQIDELEK